MFGWPKTVHERSPEPLTAGGSQPSAEQNPRLLFLVEADSAPVQDLALQIGHFGYTVRVFTRMADLPAAARQHPPAAIVIGSARPGECVEVQVLSQVQQERPKPIPVIFISQRCDLMARLMAVRAGAAAYFTRPVSVGNLVDRLDALTVHHPPDPYRILIVDDSVALADSYSLALQSAGMLTQIVNEPLRIMQPLSEFRPDLILMDLYMPECNGLELAAIIRQQEEYVSTPIVFLSAETDPQKQLQAIGLGADDFLTKPIEIDHLISAVTSRVERSRALRALMVRDSLTGLYNHTRLKELLELEVARASRQNGRFSFAMIDLDHFKQVNDTYGHPAGDGVLKTLARLLQQRLRRTDTIGRYGGEEFAVILPDTAGPAAARVMDEIRAGFAQVKQQAENAEFAVTFSCGVAEYPRYPDAQKLSEAADRALYAAKRGGRNRVVLDDG